jgi:gamma-glutamylcyclotransferase (GGCT)/AIG2-like uncharacterized protein YtfP
MPFGPTSNRLKLMSQLPGDTSLPLFVYGALKPGEISWPIIEQHIIDEPRDAKLLSHKLLVVDGVPTVCNYDGKDVRGSLVTFHSADDAYQELANFEAVPDRYVWSEAEADIPGSHVRCNVLVLANATKTRNDEVEDWNSSGDAFFGFAIPWSYEKLTKLAGKFDKSRPPSPDLYEDFLELQSVFMVLWTLTERIILFRVKNAQPDNLKYNVHMLSTLPEWAAAAASARIDTHIGIRSNRDPFSEQPTRTSAGGFNGWYEARTNVVHRGKGAFKEASSLALMTTDMHNTLAILLQEISPSVKNAWADLTKLDARMHTGRLYVIQQ